MPRAKKSMFVLSTGDRSPNNCSVKIWPLYCCQGHESMVLWEAALIKRLIFPKDKNDRKCTANLLLSVISAIFHSTSQQYLSHPFYLETSQYAFQVSSNLASFRSGYMKQKTQTWKNVIFSKASVRIVYSYPCFPEQMLLIFRNWQPTDKLVCWDHGLFILLKLNSLLIQFYWLLNSVVINFTKINFTDKILPFFADFFHTQKVTVWSN